MRIHAGMHGGTKGKQGGKRGRFQEDGEEGKKTGKIFLPERKKMDTGKQQKGGRFREKEEDLDGRGRLATPYTGTQRLKSLAAGVRRPRFPYWAVSSMVPSLRLVPEGDAAHSSAPGGV